jgi:hypothetical protein
MEIRSDGRMEETIFIGALQGSVNRESQSVGRTRHHQGRGANHYTTSLGPSTVERTLFFSWLSCNGLSGIVFDAASELFVVLTT